jgi:hypothetical protein
MRSLHTPLKIAGFSAGLIQEREEFLLPNDAFPTLVNAFVFREKVKRKQGTKLLGRLGRELTAQSLGTTAADGSFTGNIRTILSLETNAEISPGSVSITIGSQTYTDANENGELILLGGGTGTINYSTLAISIQTSPILASTAITAAFTYFPSLPSMGLRQRELVSTSQQQTIAFDTKYAYIYGVSWTEWIPGTTWTGNDANFFWSTNYWVSASNSKLFWVTNNKDPIRYTDGATWTDFTPQLDSGGNLLSTCLCFAPFRGRLVVFNTVEGTLPYYQRIRWSAIGSPLLTNSWRDDIIGQGGFLDIPTSEAITTIGFVRDYLIVSCENSTWQLRYTGLSIQPFQIEKSNSELGIRSTFSCVQFDTSIVGTGNKGFVTCDSYKSALINIKIPDLTFQFGNTNSGPIRIQGIRDFIQRVAYWTYPYPSVAGVPVVYPNRRLLYNYENDSWAIFTDSFTSLGTFQVPIKRTWADSHFTWASQHITWVAQQNLTPEIIGGNQQGFISYLDAQQANDKSLSINAITGNVTTSTVIQSINHNLQTGQVISIGSIPTGTGYSTLNDQVFSIIAIDANQFSLFKYNPSTEQFSDPQLDISQSYIGGGVIYLRDNFNIVSKKFNFLDEGKNIQLNQVDFLMENTSAGAVTLNVYLDYNDTTPINVEPENNNIVTSQSDPFFESIVPTSQEGGIKGQKSIQRLYCPVTGNFITLELTLSNSQMIGVEQQSYFQLDMLILWIRRAGKNISYGV